VQSKPRHNSEVSLPGYNFGPEQGSHQVRKFAPDILQACVPKQSKFTPQFDQKINLNEFLPHVAPELQQELCHQP